jgi:hypothetical protein
MHPLLWTALLVVLGVAGAALAARSRPETDPFRNRIRAAGDRLVGLDQERAIERAVDEVLRAVASQLRHGVVAGTVSVRMGVQVFAAAAPAGDVEAISAAITSSLGRSAAVSDISKLTIVVLREPSLDPAQVAVAVSDRQSTPTPMPIVDDEPIPAPANVPASTTVRARLRPLSKGLPSLDLDFGRELTIGRHQCDLALPERTRDEHGTGRVHAVLLADRDRQEIHLRDNRSTNHTFINGERVTSATAQHLDTIALGTAQWLVVIEEVA